MTLAPDADLEEFVLAKDELSGADIKVGMSVEGRLLPVYVLFIFLAGYLHRSGTSCAS